MKYLNLTGRRLSSKAQNMIKVDILSNPALYVKFENILNGGDYNPNTLKSFFDELSSKVEGVIINDNTPMRASDIWCVGFRRLVYVGTEI